MVLAVLEVRRSPRGLAFCANSWPLWDLVGRLGMREDNAEAEGNRGDSFCGEGRDGALQVQLGVLPVLEAAIALERGAAEMDHLGGVLEELDVAAKEEVLASGAKAHFVQGPPLLEGIVGLQELELAAEGGDQGLQGFWSRIILGVHDGMKHRECEGVQWIEAV